MDKPVTDPAPPTRRLGRPEITGVLGRGAMGDVYAALALVRATDDPVFRESFTQQERDGMEPSIEALLHYDGVHLPNRRNIHIDHSIADLARLVNDTMATRQREE